MKVVEYRASVFWNKETASRVHANFPDGFHTDICYDSSVNTLGKRDIMMALLCSIASYQEVPRRKNWWMYCQIDSSKRLMNFGHHTRNQSKTKTPLTLPMPADNGQMMRRNLPGNVDCVKSYPHLFTENGTNELFLKKMRIKIS